MPVARRLGRYTLLEKVGCGGLADVFLAESEGADGFTKRVVIKRLREELASDPETRDEADASLEAEAHLARRLSHGNVVQVLDFGRDDDGNGFVVMEWVEGCSLRAVIDAGLHRGQEGTAVLVIEAVAAALDYAHTLTDADERPMGLVHRDVKPGNVLLSKRGVVKLTDFGIAKTRVASTHTVPGLIKGTPRYIAPEQAAAKRVDARADIYGLGVVLAELAPDPPADLQRIIERATELAPRDRYPSMAEFSSELLAWRSSQAAKAHPRDVAEWVRRAIGASKPVAAIDLNAALAGGAPAPATKSLATPSAPPPTSRRRWIAWSGAAVVLSGVGIVAWAEREPQSLPAGPQPAPAQASQTETERTESVVLPAPIDLPPADVPPPTDVPKARSDPPPTDHNRSPEPAAKRRGRLKVNVLPYAEVTLDGKALGRTPVDHAVPSGSHTLVLSNPATGRTTTQEIHIDAGRTLTLKRW